MKTNFIKKNELKPFLLGVGAWIVIMVILQFFFGWESAFLLSLAAMLLIGAAVFIYDTFKKGRNGVLLAYAIWAIILAVVLAFEALKP